MRHNLYYSEHCLRIYLQYVRDLLTFFFQAVNSNYSTNYQPSYSGIYDDFPPVPSVPPAPLPPDMAVWNQMSLPPPPNVAPPPPVLSSEDQLKKEGLSPNMFNSTELIFEVSLQASSILADVIIFHYTGIDCNVTFVCSERLNMFANCVYCAWIIWKYLFQRITD